MAGKNIIIRVAIILLFWLFVVPSGAKEQTSIAVLLSSSEDIYAETAAAFASEVGLPVHIYNLQGDVKKNPDLKKELFADKPSLIFALGAKAAYVAKLWTKDTPEIKVIFSMVLNWQQYHLLEGQDNVAGIAAEVAPGTQFVNLTTIMPKIKRIGVIYSEENSSQIIADARQKARVLGVELVAIPIDRPEAFQTAYKKIRWQLDAFWVLNDPITFSLENMAWLAEKCIKDRLICLGQSENIVKQGLSISVNTESRDIASQAASLARNILLGSQNVKEIGVMPPLGTNIAINIKTIGKIGVQIDQLTLNMATTIFDE
nr:hypothetical protein [Desulfobulbaceae bacterium]